MMTTFESVRNQMAAIAGILSCKIGVEPNISPAQFPMIRIVPERIVPGRPYGARTATTMIYFGSPTTTSEGMETVYDDLFDLESDIIAILRARGDRYLETLTDGDQLFNDGGRRLPYKLMSIRAEIQEPDLAHVRCSIFCAAATINANADAQALAPFAMLALESEGADWTPDLVAGSVTRLLNGAASTRTKVTASGSVAGPVGATVMIGLSAAGVLIGNRVEVITAGVDSPLAFSVQATHSAAGDVAFAIGITGDEEEFSFSGVTLAAEAA